MIKIGGKKLSDKEKKKNSGKKTLSKPIIFSFLFLGSFFPDPYGKIFAVLAGTILALYLLGLMTGKKRYFLAVVLPLITCIFVRFTSYGIYKFLFDSAFRDKTAEKFQTIVYCLNCVFGSINNYLLKSWETLCSLKYAVEGFLDTKDIRCFIEPILKNSHFFVLILAMLICIVAVFRAKKAY